jgi:hypothetical protein
MNVGKNPPFGKGEGRDDCSKPRVYRTRLNKHFLSVIYEIRYIYQIERSGITPGAKEA